MTSFSREPAPTGSRPSRRTRTFVLAALLILTCGAAQAEALVRVYAIRGFAGVAFSRGMNQLCDELARMPQVACTVAEFHDASSIEGRAAAAMAAGQRIVLVGHSLGAHAALRIAAAMQGSVPLVVTIDPNWFPTTPAVPENVEVVLNYYQDYDVLGRATLQPSPGFRGELQQFRRSEPHVMIDRSTEVHAEIVARIRAMLASHTPPPPQPPPIFQQRRR
jgi:pimeloyl-ACP methyl ester carboxylesterase